MGGEAILLLRFQLQLVVNLGKLYGAELDPEDPEDVLMIVAYAIGGSAVEGIGRVGAKAAGKAGGLIDNVNGMVTDLRAGKGTAGSLLAKDDIYADLREMIRDLKRNPWKLFWKE